MNKLFENVREEIFRNGIDSIGMWPEASLVHLYEALQSHGDEAEEILGIPMLTQLESMLETSMNSVDGVELMWD